MDSIRAQHFLSGSGSDHWSVHNIFCWKFLNGCTHFFLSFVRKKTKCCRYEYVSDVAEPQQEPGILVGTFFLSSVPSRRLCNSYLCLCFGREFTMNRAIYGSSVCAAIRSWIRSWMKAIHDVYRIHSLPTHFVRKVVQRCCGSGRMHIILPDP